MWKYTVLLSGFLSHNTKDLISIMTVTDLLASKMAHEDRCYMSKVAEAVKDVVHMAATNKRLVLGAMPSAEFLGEEADSVALCLLLENKSDDVLISIQHKLVEAYCWENDIPLLKVDSEDKVRKILSPHTDPNNNEPDDLSCILVKNADKMSSSESMLADFFDYIIKNEIEPFPVITLPE